MSEEKRGRDRLPAGAADPVFVGGTGRSGTHAISRVLDEHSAFFYFRREVRFHTDRGGYPDLLAGRTTRDEFVEAMLGRFWRRVGRDGQTRGLYNRLERGPYEEAVGRFRDRFPADPHAACRELMNDLLDPLAEAAGKPTWLEQTPPTAAVADTLHEVFPRMKLIHMVRDGRDVACSVVPRGTGPDDLRRAIQRWELRLRTAQAATSRIPSESYRVVHLEEFVHGDRDQVFGGLMEFLGVEPEARTRRWFGEHITAEAANLGRWRRDVSDDDQRRLSRLYRRSLERMERDGITAAPRLADAEMPAGLDSRSWLSRARASISR